MVARLAGPPIKWWLREGLAVAAIALPIALIVLMGWAWPLTEQPTVPIDGTMRRLTVSYASKYGPTAWIDVEMPDRRPATVTAPYMRVFGCKPGDRIHLLANRVRRGVRIVAVDPKGCRQD